MRNKRPRAGIHTIMVTGDHPVTARAIAEDAGVDATTIVTGSELARWSDDELARHIPFVSVIARSTPDQKRRIVEVARRAGRLVAVTGDGVNDAPALARADVGLAIGAGTDVAMESAGVVLATSDPRAVAGVIRLSRATYRKMVQNLVWAAGYNVISIPLAAGVLAWAGVTLSPAVGAILMSLSTIVVALNAQLLRRVRLVGTDAVDRVAA
jgi:Cu2+-exporting ATPase